MPHSNVGPERERIWDDTPFRTFVTDTGIKIVTPGRRMDASEIEEFCTALMLLDDAFDEPPEPSDYMLGEEQL